MSGRRGIVDSPYPRGCRRRRCYLTLAQIIALFAQVGYCQRIGEIDNQRGEIRAIYKNDVSSFHLSLGIRVSCMGAGNHHHEHHRHEHHRYHGHHRYEHHGYDRHDYGHHGYEHYGNYRYHHEHHWHYGNYRHHHHGYDGNHHKHPTT